MWHRDVQRRAAGPSSRMRRHRSSAEACPRSGAPRGGSFVAAPILLGLVLAATPAGAHAVPAAMDPAPNVRLDASPPEVVIRFTERVEARPSTLEVLDARGQRVDRGGATVDPGRSVALPRGAAVPSIRRLHGVLASAVGRRRARHQRRPRLHDRGRERPGDPKRRSGAEWGGDRSRAGWSRWEARSSWAHSWRARFSVSERLDGPLAWGSWEGWPWPGEGRSISCSRRGISRGRARSPACSGRSWPRRQASCGSLAAGSSCCWGFSRSPESGAVAATVGTGGSGQAWRPSS